MIIQPNNESFNCWVDPSHAADWNKNYAKDDESTAKSRKGYVLTQAGCPLLINMQSIIYIIILTIHQAYKSNYVPCKPSWHHKVKRIMKNYFPSGRNILWRYPEKIKGIISNIISSIIQNIQQSSTMYQVPFTRLKNLRISLFTMSRKIRRHNTQIHSRQAAAI